MSQVELAVALGVTANTVARWERGKLSIGNPELVGLALERLEGHSRPVPAAPTETPVRRPRGGFGLSRDPPRHNLPRQSTTFVGRRTELATLKRMISTTPLVTMTGMGGVGKSRLAIRAAAELVGEYEDGAWIADLASLTRPKAVGRTVAHLFDVLEQPPRELGQVLASTLRQRRLLLILDNCEHLAAACAALAETLLRACPGVHIIATSRTPLGLSSELVWPVPPLDLPPPGVSAETGGLPLLMRSAAVRLFVERAHEARPSFEPTAASAEVIVDICRRVDGLPLAIELAAGRLRALSLEDLRDRLEDRFRLLVGANRAALVRHQTLLATLEWSYDLLTAQERALFRRLAVFSEGWTLEAAERVAAVDSADTAELLLRLVEKSLVVAEASADGLEMRYRLLETLRQFARERLEAAGEAETVRAAHAEYYLDLAEDVGWATLGPGMAARIQQLQQEYANLRTALRFWLEHEDAERGLRQAAALRRFWALCGHSTEGQRWLDRFLALPGAVSAPLPRAAAMSALCSLLREDGDFGTAWLVGLEALDLVRATNDPRELARALLIMGSVARRRCDFDTGRRMFEEASALFRAADAPLWVALASVELGFLALDQGFPDEAMAHYEAGRAVWSSIAPRLRSWTTYLRGDLAAARMLTKESLTQYRLRGDGTGIVESLIDLSHISLDSGDFDAARRLLAESLAIAEQRGLKFLPTRSLVGTAGLLSALGQATEALRLGGAAERLRELYDCPTPPITRPLIERRFARARAALDAEQADAAWQAGRALSAEDAIAEAIAALDGSGQTAPPGATAGRASHPFRLTSRELEVLRLLAAAKSNRAIAAELVLSERTVARHLESIYAKLGVNSRTAAAGLALRSGLL